MNTSSPNKPTNKLLLTAAYYLSFIMLGLLTAAEGPALPGLAKNTSSTLDQISLIFIFGSLGYLLGSLFSGQAYDRLPGHRLMAFTFLLISTCAALIPFMHNLWLLLSVMFVLGLAKSALDVGCNTLLLWVHGEKVGPFMNGLHFFFGLGAFGAPLILARVLLVTNEIWWVFWLFALLSLPIAAWLWNLPGSPVGTKPQENGNAPFPVIPVTLIVLAFLFYVGAEISFGNWIYTYALTLGLGTEVTAAYLTSAFWGTFTVGRLLGVWISSRARAATILFVDLLGCLASLGLILLWPDSAPVLWAGAIGLGLFMASVFPTTLMLAGERMRVTGTMTGWFLAGASIGGMSLPWGIGQAFVRIGAAAMPVLVLAAVAVNLLVILLFLVRPVRTLQTA
ncbi:MAG: MFS transporter [Anaerolineales bacterium]|nr:MFS transporter [Anaerolineales bacterium]